MRVIAGSARSIPLKTLPGDATRPTTDRIKETLFNILMNDVPGSRFLDLFAGSGSIGIEALSRGASYAVFVENSRTAAGCIARNLSKTHLESCAKIMICDAGDAVRKLDKEPPFDLIFMDPPYDFGMAAAVLEALKNSTAADPHSRIIIEASVKTDPSEALPYGYQIERVKTYKTNQHIFLRLAV